MYSKQITFEQFEELIKQQTTTQAVSLLKSFSPNFKNLENNPKRIKINKVLDDILIKDIKKISRLLNKNDKKVFDHFISIYKIKCLKIVFRKIISNNHINESANVIENWTNNIFNDIKGIENVKDDFEKFLSTILNASIFLDPK